MLQSMKQMAFGNLFLGLALLFLGFTFFFMLTNYSEAIKSGQWVAHTYQVKEQVERLASDVKDAERAERGYLITNDPSYLALFDLSVKHSKATAVFLQQLTRDNPQRQAHLRQLNQLILLRLNVLRQVLKRQQQDGFEAAQALVLTGKGKRLMDNIQAMTNTMLNEEDLLIKQRRQTFEDVNRWVYLLSGLFFVLALIPLVSGYYFLRMSANRYRLLLLEKNNYVAQLEQSNQELEMVATIASHDLKTPLRKISFFVGEILRDPANSLSAESVEFSERIRVSLDKLQGLIEHLLVIAKRKAPVLPHEMVNLQQVAQEVAFILEGQIRDSGGAVKIGDMCSIQGDRYELAQLLQNLIENGLKYHRPGVPPVVNVMARQTTDGQCEIRVKDNGLGVEKQHQKEIFNMFSRMPGQAQCDGSGVGLGTVSKIVRHHHGTVNVESQPGEGSEFIVTLPVSHTGVS